MKAFLARSKFNELKEEISTVSKMAKNRITIKQFKSMTRDWPLTETFYKSMLTGIKHNKSEVITEMEPWDMKWCAQHGFQVEIFNQSYRIEL